MSIHDTYLHLLREWTDALLSLMVSDPAHPSLDGGILCPSCTLIHGRCHEAVYPFLAMADFSGEDRYLEGARKLFAWSETMLCDDGSLYNDSQNPWNGTTVFSALSLYRALRYHGQLLEKEEKALWEERLYRLSLWLLEGITPEKAFNINYIAANASAMARLGRYFNHPEMLRMAKCLADFALEHITGSGLVYGEGSLERNATPRGGCAVDIGYNVEETLPSLWDYTVSEHDGNAMDLVRRAVRAHLNLMLPDGAWDNSFGTRNFKWTYWGSRTADGCQAMLNSLGREDPVFAEAAYRNLLLYRRCTDGLLYGGPHLKRHGELPCAHHAFCHAKVLAQALDEGITEFSRVPLPSDTFRGIRYDPEIGTCTLARGDWIMTMCTGDFPYMKGGHASGGAVTLLWHRFYGPVFAAANTDLSRKEPTNQQLSRKKKALGSLCPRLECAENGTVYAQVYDFSASLVREDFPDRSVVHVRGMLCDPDHRPAPVGYTFHLSYTLSDQCLSVKGRTDTASRLILPVICTAGHEPVRERGSVVFDECLRIRSFPSPEIHGAVFSLAPGFEAVNLCVSPARDGSLDVTISLVD